MRGASHLRNDLVSLEKQEEANYLWKQADKIAFAEITKLYTNKEIDLMGARKMAACRYLFSRKADTMKAGVAVAQIDAYLDYLQRIR